WKKELYDWLSTWADVQDTYGDATLLRVDLGYGPLGGMGAATAYVDDFTLTVDEEGTITYELEPTTATDATTSVGEVGGVTSVDPATGDINTTPTVTITGFGFKTDGETTAATAVTFSGEGIAVAGLTVVSNTKITANLAIADNAPAGPRNVVVTIPTGTLTGFGLFEVVQSLTLTAPSDISLGLMIPGATATGQSVPDGIVVTNASAWTVDAADVKVTETGYMNTVPDGNGTSLAAPFRIGNVVNTYVDAVNGITYDSLKALPFYVSQA
ncbi:unnamed protein product, partial [marine sediment metagenome]